MTPRTTMRDALADPHLLGTLLHGDTWRAWRTILIAAMGEALNDDERELFRKLTSRDREPGQRVEELIGVVGRRGGKSRAISVLACYLAGLCEYPSLVKGERGVVLCIAPDQRQAHITLDYAAAGFEATAMMRKLIANKTADTLSLTTGIDIDVRASSFRRLRGLTYVGVIADEAAFYMADDRSANPDAAILNAVRPGLATTKGLLAVISSPYARRGELWESYRAHYGPNADPLILVAQGASRDFNPSLPQSVVDRALERDRAAASAEYLAQFRTDVEGFLTREMIEATVDRDVMVRPPLPNVEYHSFIDASGGVRDSFTAAIAHDEDGTAVLDCLIEVRPPFNPDSATEQICDVLKSYHCSTTIGDRYGAEWVVFAFKKCGVTLRHSDRDRSSIYLDALPLFTTGRARLLDNKRLISQLASLERRTSPVGKDRVDHGPGGHDDVANVASAALVLVAMKKVEHVPVLGPVIIGINQPAHDATKAFYQWSGHRKRWDPT